MARKCWITFKGKCTERNEDIATVANDFIDQERVSGFSLDTKEYTARTEQTTPGQVANWKKAFAA